MARSLYAYNPQFRAPRGGPVIDIQKALAQAGDFPMAIDGVFAGQTQTAIRAWQAKAGQPQTGFVDVDTWTSLTTTPPPALFRRCLALTAAFEGQGYTLAVGNFDGAGLTWGIVGFTLLTGDLAKVLKMINAQAPAVMASAFGANLAQLLHILDAPKSEQTAWANSVSSGASNANLRTDWKDAFETLGNAPEARAVQDQVAHDDYWRIAARDLGHYGKMTERDAAIFFDTAVQSGGVNAAKGAAITAALGALAHDASDHDRLAAIAQALTTGVNPTYAGDVHARRMAIATGSGQVHGAPYQISGWAIDLLPIVATDLA